MQTQRFSYHHACVMAPEEAIITRKRSTAQFAIPPLFDA
jgi:hypothetical protein